MTSFRPDLPWAAYGLAVASVFPLEGPTDAPLRYDPAPSSTWSTSLETEREVQGGELTVLMNGEQVPSTFLPELDLDELETRTLEMVETVVRRGEDGPDEWLRRYEQLAWTNEGTFSMSGPDGEQSFPWSAEAEDRLGGRTVRFWAAGEGEFAREFADGRASSDGSLLEGLRGDMSWSWLLPAEPVSVGDSWSVSGDVLAALLEPAGELGLEMPEEAAAYLFPEIHSTETDGELSIEWERVSDSEPPLAYLEVTGELTRVTVGPGDLSQVPVVDGTATDTTTLSIELEGEVVWDLAANRLHELELGGALTTETLTVRDQDTPGPEYESTFEAEGTYRITVRSRAEETPLVEAGAE